MRFGKLMATASALALGLGIVTGTASADNNDMFVEQVGSFNFDYAPQSGNFNESFIRQNGNRNTVSVTGAGAAGSLDGNRNDLLMLQQTNRSIIEMAISDQDSSNNRFVGVQRNGNENVILGPNSSGANNVPGGQDRNTYAAVQDGSSNIIHGGGARTGASAPEAGISNTFTIGVPSIDTIGTALDPALIPAGLPSNGRNGNGTFGGNDNVVLLSQFGDANQLGVIVQGNRNSIVGSGEGTVASLNTNTEAGANFFNDATSNPDILATDALLSNGAGFIPGSGGFASQDGFGNKGMLVQGGDDNTIVFDQIGNNNTSAVYQSGNTNYSMASQL